MPLTPVAVVIGLSQNGLGVVRALGRAGVPVIAVSADPDDAYARTRYARRVAHADLTGDALIDTLWDIGRTLDAPAVLIPTTDRTVLTLSSGRRRLEPYFRHSLPEAPLVERLMNKVEIARYARSEGFSTPRAWDVASPADLAACEHEIGFPCILKPQVKTIAFAQHAPQKAYMIRSVPDLRDTYRQVAAWAPEVVVQEWIGGPDSALVFSLYYFDNRSRPLAAFTGRKLRQYIPYCGTACAAEPCVDEYVEEAGIRFFQACGYRGFGAIEFKRGEDGRYYLMEPTVGRTEHLFALAAANGVNLPLIGYRDMAALPHRAAQRSPRPVRYVDWRRDLRAALFYRRRGELSVSDWVRTMTGARQHALFAWDDPAPSLHRLRNMAGNRIRRLGSRMRAWSSGGLGAQRARNVMPIVARRLPRPAAQLRSNDVHAAAAVEWLCAAQDAGGGGVARGFTLQSPAGGPQWQPAYPETTGYIIPTMFDCAERFQRPDWRARAVRMADWLAGVQYPSGGITGGVQGQNLPPVVFNTGMVLHGWCRAYEETRDVRYLSSISRAAAFVVEAQDQDGGWRRFTTIRSEPHVHAYDVLVAWPLLLAADHLGDSSPRDAARRNIEFTLTLQQPNGWFRQNGLRPRKHGAPLTHTIGYTLQGLLECGVLLNDARCIDQARVAADAVLAQLSPVGYLAGEFDAEWRPAARWCCLTGTAQMAIVWLRLFALTGEDKYFAGAVRANTYVKATQVLDPSSPAGLRGGIAGSYPLSAEYGRRQILNWATKYFADALLAEERCSALEGAVVTAAGRSAGV